MKLYQKADGGVLSSAREYDIAQTTDIKEGALVKIVAGLVVACDGTSAPIGVAAETHSGVADALNPRNDGTKILVHDAPDAIFRCAAPRAAATGGTATTVTFSTLAAFADDDFIGGYLKLVKKGASSTNADAIGTVKRITDSVYVTSGTVTTLTVASGATACEGDEFEIYPPFGFKKAALDSGKQKIVLTSTASSKLKVVGRGDGFVDLMACEHALGVEE